MEKNDELAKIADIKDLLKAGKLKAAFNKARELDASSNFAQDNILLEGRFSRLEDEWNRGMVGFGETAIERNRIETAFFNYLQEYENEIIKEKGKEGGGDGMTALAQLIMMQSNLEDKFINSLKEFRTQENKHEVEAIRRLIKYDYRMSWKELSTDIKIQIDKKALKLQRPLSYGMNTVVFAASDSRHTGLVLKVLYPKLYDKTSSVFKERHEKAKNLFEKSGKIAQVIDVCNFAKSDIIFAIIEKYDYDLREFVTKSSLSEGEYYNKVGELFAGVCEAVKFLHENSVAHRDVIPSNVFLDKNHNVYLGDFDNIQIKDSSATKIDERHRAIEGNDIFFDVFIEPKYVNQINGEFNYSFEDAKKADIYSLCVLLLFCIIRKRFSNNIELIDFLKSKSGDENSMRLYAIDILEFPYFSGKINADVSNFLHKGLNKNEKERYANVDELLNHFEPIRNKLHPPNEKNDFLEKNKNLTDELEMARRDGRSKNIVFSIAFLSLLCCCCFFMYKNYNNKQDVQEDWNRVDYDVFFNKDLEEITKSYMESSAYFMPLQSPNDRSQNTSILTRIKKYDEKVSGELSPKKCSPIRGNADYTNISLQVNGMEFDSAALLFSGVVDKVLASSDKLRNLECHNYSNLNDVLELPNKLKEKVQVTLMFIYYSEDVSKGKWSFLRFPRTELDGRNYNPTDRPWYLTMTNQDKKMLEGVSLDKTNHNIKISPPYYSYSAVTKGPVRTILKKVDVDKNKELIFGIDIELK